MVSATTHPRDVFGRSAAVLGRGARMWVGAVAPCIEAQMTVQDVRNAHTSFCALQVKLNCCFA